MSKALNKPAGDQPKVPRTQGQGDFEYNLCEYEKLRLLLDDEKGRAVFGVDFDRDKETQKSLGRYGAVVGLACMSANGRDELLDLILNAELNAPPKRHLKSEVARFHYAPGGGAALVLRGKT
ncbi:MAG TPA: hypothetical protein VNI02_17445, partial [Blastocatellia bacterium]|nr:hypothetical protein [Blastocatellia bacterium]